jgi:hypothetical protein
MTDRLLQEKAHGMSVAPDARVVREEPRTTAVRAHTQVLVVGGGPAGVGAALAAASEKAHVTLVERYGLPGGMWTAGLVNPFFEAQSNGWLVRALMERLHGAGAWMPWKFAHTFDPEVMKRELDAMLLEAGVEVLYHALGVDAVVEDGTVRGIIVESKAGREALLADVVVDCTGDGDIAARAGARYELGRLGDGLVQPMTLMFEMDGVPSDYDQVDGTDLYDRVMDAVRRAGLDYELPVGRVGYAPWIITTPVPGRAAVQLTHVYRLNPLNPAHLTQASIEGRRQVVAAVEALRRVPGLESIRLTQSATQIGIRETRRIVGHYRLTLDDLAAGRRFPDAVAVCRFGVDIHEPAPGAGVPSGHGAKMLPYEIPYRCLVPADLDGLLVAGRCISGSHEAHASYRVTGTCMALGQAAGLAAAWCAREGILPAKLDGTRLRTALVERGVEMLKG